MIRALRRLLPRRIAAQLAAVVVLSVVLIHTAVTTYFHFLRDTGDFQSPAIVHVDTLVRLTSVTPAGEQRARLVAGAANAFPALGISLAPSRPPDYRPVDPRSFGFGFEDLGPDIAVTELRPPDGAAPPPAAAPDRGPGAPGAPHARSAGGTRNLAFGLSGGEWLILSQKMRPRPFFEPVTVSIVFALFCSALLGLWAARGLVGPLRALAAAARDFDIEGEPSPLPRLGPEEIRVAGAAFDAMRRRIRSLVEDRTRMLAAMGHDLRTPITRLRLRCEFVADENLRAEFLRDLAHMNDMIGGALTYLREGRHAEQLALVDLSAMIQTLCDQWTDLGKPAEFEGPDHLLRHVRREAVTRAFSNLIDNALNHASRATVRLAALPGGGTLVEIEDDGPGIPAADREAMLRPFVRGDSARNMDDHHGFGLGLAIVKSVVEGHGGRLSLLDAVPHGLLVRIELPGESEALPSAA